MDKILKYLFKLLFGVFFTTIGNAQSIINQDSILDFVEQMHEFTGGNDSMMNFIKQNFIYPPIALEKDLQGNVVVSFVINEKGKVTNAKVIDSKYIISDQYKSKKLSSEKNALNDEALRIVNAMPDWKPGYQNGNPAKVLFRLPIKFSISEEISESKKDTLYQGSDLVITYVEPSMDEVALMKHYLNNMKYPIQALEYNMEGVVTVEYVIDEAGKLKNAHVVKSIFNYEDGNKEAQDALKKEALRIVNSFKKWRIHTKDGKAVEVKYNMPFTFKLDN